MPESTARSLLDAYLAATNTHDFDHVAELLVDEPVYFFADATLTSKSAVRAYFERTWTPIPDEEYWAEDIQWPVHGPDGAVAIYRHRWRGTDQRPRKRRRRPRHQRTHPHQR